MICDGKTRMDGPRSESAELICDDARLGLISLRAQVREMSVKCLSWGVWELLRGEVRYRWGEEGTADGLETNGSTWGREERGESVGPSH